MASSDDLKELLIRWRALRELVGREMEAFEEALSAAIKETSPTIRDAPPPESKAPDPPAAVPAPPATVQAATAASSCPYDPPRDEMDVHEYVLFVVANVPEQDQGEMALRAYGENNKNTRKWISNVLGHLSRAGKIVNDGYGRWRIRQPGERPRKKR